MPQQRLLMVMTLLLTSFSAVKSCQPRNFVRRACSWPAMNCVSRLKLALPVPSTTLRRHALSRSAAGTHVVLRANGNSPITAFQCRPCLPVHVAAPNPPTSTAHCATSHTTADLTTKWADPGQTVSPETEYVLRFAAKSKGSTRVAGSGMVLYDDAGAEVWWGHQRLGEVTPNEADYITLVTGLQCARSLGVQRITAQGCNDLVHRQMEGIFKVKKPSLKEHYEKAVSLRREFGSFQINRVDKDSNKRATELAKEAMTGQTASTDLFESNNSATAHDRDEGSGTNVSPPLSPNSDVSFDPAVIFPDKMYVLRFDGGSRGNPGTAGAGMVLYDSEDGSELWSGYQYIGSHNTNNEAEYMGLITGLQCARALGVEQIVVQGDSQLILRQVDGKYKVKSPTLKGYYNKAMVLRREFASFETGHIERARNGRADELANKAMDTKSSRGFDNA